MKKITFKAILVGAVILLGMTNTMNAATITVSSDAESAGVNYNTIQKAYDYVKALPALTEKYVVEIQASYDPTTGATKETFPITFAANTASATYDITIKPATGVKVTLAALNKTVIATGMTFTANTTSPANLEATIDLSGKITVGDISLISNASYIAGMGTYTGGTFKKVTSLTGNVLTVPIGTFASAKTGVNLYFGEAQTKTITFNGAKYVTIDGVSRTGATGLTIQNPNCIYAQTIYIAGNSQYNTIKNCIVRGANQTGAWNNGYQGTIYFAGGQYNTIDNNDVCDMNDPLIPYPICAFQMTAAGGTNTNQTLSNNNIYNISNQYSGNGTCVFIQFGSDGNSVNHSVLNNRFYWTAPTTFSNAGITFFGFGTAGLGHKVENNVFGYGSSDGTGKSTLTFTGSGTIYAMNGIKNSTCKNNTIGGIDIVGTSFVGIGLSAHTSGSLTAADDICYGNQVKDITVNNAASGTLYGLLFGAPITNVNVKNNVVKNLTISSAIATIPSSIQGIVTNFGASGTLAINCIGNELSNLTAGNSGSTANNTVTAFVSGGFSNIFEKNLIYNLNATGSAHAGVSSAYVSGGANTATTMTLASTTGMYLSDVITGGTGLQSNTTITAISGNQITLSKALNAQASGTYTTNPVPFTIKGMRFQTSKADGVTIKNNIIRLGTDVSSDVEISAIINEGLSGASHPFNIYHNSIYIGGTSQTKPSHCLSRSGATSGAISIQNNILSNVRTGGAAVNQVYNLYAATDITTSQNNLYQYGSLFGTVTTTSPATFTALSDWNTARMTASLSEDTNSKDQQDPLFNDATGATPDMHVSTTSPANESGVAIAAVTDDYAGMLRADYIYAPTSADMGAYVISYSTAVESAKQLSDLSVYGAQNNIMFNNLSGNTAKMYTLSGQLLQTITLTSDKVAVPSAKGLYIVKVGEKVNKVLVK